MKKKSFQRFYSIESADQVTYSIGFYVCGTLASIHSPEKIGPECLSYSYTALEELITSELAGQQYYKYPV